MTHKYGAVHKICSFMEYAMLCEGKQVDKFCWSPTRINTVSSVSQAGMDIYKPLVSGEANQNQLIL